MSFDITIHPIGQLELQRFVFDVVTNPQLAKARANEIASDANSQEKIMRLYGMFEKWRSGEEDCSCPFGWAAAVIAGHVHRYWYARNECLSFANDTIRLFEPLAAFGPNELKAWPNASNRRIESNYSASGLIPVERFGIVRQILSSGAVKPRGNGRMQPFTQEAVESYTAALEYAEQRGLMLIEAAEIVIPLESKCYSLEANLHAHFLRGQD